MNKETAVAYAKNIHRVIILGIIHFLSLLFLSVGSGLTKLFDYMDKTLPILGQDNDKKD